jgi:predicted P-loop ATPase
MIEDLQKSSNQPTPLTVVSVLEIQKQIATLAADLEAKIQNKQMIDAAALDQLLTMRKERDRMLAAMPESERYKITAAPSHNGNGTTVPKDEETRERRRLICNAAGVLHYLKNNDTWAGHIWRDDFHRRIFSDIKNGIPQEWNESDDIHLMTHLQVNGFPMLRLEMVRNAINEYANLNVRNEPKDWLNSLEWDGVPRIADFFMDCMGSERAEDNSYLFAVGANFWISLAARIYQPGCRVYHMIVLEGKQGIGKSTALSVIGGPWYAEATESVNQKDFFLTIAGKLIIEISELDSFNRAEVTRIKAVISSSSDRFRSPYERRSMDHPRSCIFVGTTNEDTYLRDATGARRFWPVRCGKVDLEKIRTTREQLFAEAAAEYRAGHAWHVVPQDQAAQAQELRREEDIFEDLLRDKLLFDTPVRILDVCNLIGVPSERLDRRLQLRIANALRQIGYVKGVSRASGKLSKVWLPAIDFQKEG